MLPNGGVDGWATEEITTELLYPRNDKKQKFKAKSLLYSLPLVWRLEYFEGNDALLLYNDLGEVDRTFTIPDLVCIDLTFDQLDRPVYVMENILGEIWLYWYNPVSNQQEFTLITSGNNPCCTLDDRRIELSSIADIFIFYQRGDLVFYRLQRDRYLIEYPVYHNKTEVILETCGMGTNLRLTLRYQVADAFLLMVGDKHLRLDSDYVGLPYGEIP